MWSGPIWEHVQGGPTKILRREPGASPPAAAAAAGGPQQGSLRQPPPPPPRQQQQQQPGAAASAAGQAADVAARMAQVSLGGTDAPRATQQQASVWGQPARQQQGQRPAFPPGPAPRGGRAQEHAQREDGSKSAEDMVVLGGECGWPCNLGCKVLNIANFSLQGCKGAPFSGNCLESSVVLDLSGESLFHAASINVSHCSCEEGSQRL